MENLLMIVKNQFAISQSGISASWLLVALIAIVIATKNKIQSIKK